MVTNFQRTQFSRLTKNREIKVPRKKLSRKLPARNLIAYQKTFLLTLLQSISLKISPYHYKLVHIIINKSILILHLCFNTHALFLGITNMLTWLYFF